MIVASLLVGWQKSVESPTVLHWQAGKRVMHHLVSTKDYAVKYSASKDVEPVGYVDSDYAVDLASQKSTTGYIFLMAGGAVSWCSVLQEVAALSLTEAEYVSLTTEAKKSIWLRSLLSHLDTGLSLFEDGVTILKDSQRSMNLARNGPVH